GGRRRRTSPGLRALEARKRCSFRQASRSATWWPCAPPLPRSNIRGLPRGSPIWSASRSSLSDTRSPLPPRRRSPPPPPRRSRWRSRSRCGACTRRLARDRGACTRPWLSVGGAFGLASLPIELPLSTIIMLRSIAEIARGEGEDLSDPEAALSCVQVFALGGRPGSADASESGYFAVRGILAKSVTQAARFVVERGVVEEGGPVLVRFITQVASRFGLVVTQKLAAQAIPLVGALG